MSLISHMQHYGINQVFNGGPTLTRSLNRKELPDGSGDAFSVDSQLDHPTLEYVDRFLVQRTDDGWKPVSTLPEQGVGRQQVADSFGIWQDASEVRKGFPLFGKKEIASRPDGAIQEHEVTPFTYGESNAGIATSLLGSEILADSKEGSFSLRSTAQPESDNFLERTLNLGESSKSHHDKVLADDKYWIIRS
ncbi:MAG: hypothetical protein WC314_15905 [Vulcanimicrobiota bacterium]